MRPLKRFRYFDATTNEMKDHVWVCNNIKKMTQNQVNTLMQDTGYLIGGDQLLFENDLIKAPSGLILHVKWCEEEFAIRAFDKDGNYYNINMPLYTIVGNTYQDYDLFLKDINQTT